MTASELMEELKTRVPEASVLVMESGQSVPPPHNDNYISRRAAL
jgi:hypothetical protein